MEKKIIGKLERKMIMTWMLIWLNWSVATINVTFQLLDIYIYIQMRERERDQFSCTIFKKLIYNFYIRSYIY